MKKSIILLAFPLALLSACGSSPAEADQKTALEEKVLGIHDEAMARMGEIYKLRRQLRSIRDTLEQQPQTDSTTILSLQQEIQGLNQADEVMMQWMRQYEAPDSLQAQQAINYLQQELIKIERVQYVMDSTINAAKQTANQYEQQK